MDRIISQSRLPVQLNPASLVFFLAAALSAWLVVLAWGRRNEPSAPPLISLILFEGLWALCEAIEAVLVEERDLHVNALGIKGVGEIGITGTAGAVANAVWHATGVRVRKFPIKLDRVIEPHC